MNNSNDKKKTKKQHNRTTRYQNILIISIKHRGNSSTWIWNPNRMESSKMVKNLSIGTSGFFFLQQKNISQKSQKMRKKLRVLSCVTSAYAMMYVTWQ